MSSDGMKVIQQFINPNPDKRVEQQLEQLRSENQGLLSDVNAQYKVIGELDAERTRLNENQLDELESDYLENYKDAKGRLNNIQDETAKVKLEFINATDRLQYAIEEGCKIDRQGDRK